MEEYKEEVEIVTESSIAIDLPVRFLELVVTVCLEVIL